MGGHYRSIARSLKCEWRVEKVIRITELQEGGKVVSRCLCKKKMYMLRRKKTDKRLVKRETGDRPALGTQEEY